MTFFSTHFALICVSVFRSCLATWFCCSLHYEEHDLAVCGAVRPCCVWELIMWWNIDQPPPLLTAASGKWVKCGVWLCVLRDVTICGTWTLTWIFNEESAPLLLAALLGAHLKKQGCLFSLHCLCQCIAELILSRMQTQGWHRATFDMFSFVNSLGMRQKHWRVRCVQCSLFIGVEDFGLYSLTRSSSSWGALW